MIVPAITAEHLTGTHVGYVLERGNGKTVRGFGLRCYPSGRKTFVLRYGGKTHAIGDPELISVEEARRRAREKKLALIDGPAPPDVTAAKRTLGDLFEEHWNPSLKARLDSEELAPGTFLTYSNLWDNALLPRFGGTLLSRLTVAALEEWKRAAGACPVLFNRALQQLSAALSYAVRIEWLPANPAVHVKPYGEHPSERMLSDEEIRRWAAALWQLEEGGEISPAAAAALWTLFYSGARPGEIVGARRHQLRVAGEVGHLELPRAKGDRPGRVRGRVIRIPAPALEKILAQPCRDGCEEPLLRGVTLVRLRSLFARVCQRAGIKRATPKVLRHVWRSVAPEAGVDKEHLRRLGGWASHRVPDSVYAHDRPALDEAAARIGEKLKEIAHG